MKKVIHFKPSMRIIENCRHCMYSHYEYKTFSMKTNYFCLCLGTGPVDALKKAKVPVYQGDGKYGVDKLEDMSYAYIENPDNILPDCPLEDYIE
jgi:hypothetical protein